MSKRKGNDKSAEQSPPRLLRTFKHDYRIEEVREVARMLYALRPFAPDEKSELKWNSLARQAFDFLDRLDKACAEIARQRRSTDAAYRRAESRSADAETWLETLPYDKAARTITRERWTRRANEKFEKFVLAMPCYFGGVEPARAQLGRWREDGMMRDEVIELQILADNAREKLQADRQAKRERKQAPKRRKPRFNDKDAPVIREVIREKQAREIT